MGISDLIDLAVCRAKGCPSCNKQGIPDSADTCPNCGNGLGPADPWPFPER